MMTAKDKRLALTAELLRGLRSVKLMGWEDVMRVKVRGHRGGRALRTLA